MNVAPIKSPKPMLESIVAIRASARGSTAWLKH